MIFYADNIERRKIWLKTQNIVLSLQNLRVTVTLLELIQLSKRTIFNTRVKDVFTLEN